MRVRNELTDYSKNGTRTVYIDSTPFETTAVTIRIGGEYAILDAEELCKAIENATNITI